MTTATPAPRGLRTRLRGLVREVMKFGTVGLFGVVVNLAVFNLCIHAFHWAPVRSGVLSTLVAIGTNYIGYRFWVYRDRDAAARSREITLFLIFSGIGMVIENGTLWISHYTLGFQTALADNIAKNVIGLGLGTLFRFISFRTWVFRALPQLEEPAAEAEGEPALALAGPKPAPSAAEA
ncbi:GtrA family protein [Peterkaempfera griseoplana]|uniref:GtrA family protein n=1 Tax=Peterkaempfera griseoplana TaxID=66896 RepID=UPI0006E3C040|nr:GtrA family protein [Peterkaempfera griseoplana]